MNRHPTDYLSLVFGILFVATGLVVAAGRIDAISWSWIAPVAAVVLGGIIIVAARPHRGEAPDPDAS